MKNWGIHSGYIIGILAGLLIMSIALQWDHIPDLPGVISFALGLASLLLAMIAIFQSIRSTGSVESSLAAVRQSAEDGQKSSYELTAVIDDVRQAAQEAKNAAASALEAMKDIEGLSAEVVRSTADSKASIEALRDEFKAKNAINPSAEAPIAAGPATLKSYPFVNEISFGGAAITYAAILSFETGKGFDSADMPPGSGANPFARGYLAALDDIGFIKISRDDNWVTVIDAKRELIDAKNIIANKRFSPPNISKKHKKAIGEVAAYFEASDDTGSLGESNA